jgi:hypothetical protein
VVVALWRAPERRRRYLPVALVVFTLMCYAGMRLVSLHQIDALLYHRELAGLKIDTVLELIGLGVALGSCVWAASRRRTLPRPATSAGRVARERVNGQPSEPTRPSSRVPG